MNLSGGAEFWQPLTGAVIFGLASATVLTLVVIPVCYSLAYNWADRDEKPAPDGAEVALPPHDSSATPVIAEDVLGTAGG